MYNQPRTIKFFLIAFRLLPFLTDHFVLACVCVRSTWKGVQAMPIWIHVWSTTYDSFLCCRIQPSLPLLTDYFCSCVWMCQVQVKRPLGDAYLNTCHNLFFLGHIQIPVLCDRPLCFPCVYVTGSCVRNIWRGVQAMSIWIHLWYAVHSPFFLASYRLWPVQTDHLFNRVCMCQEQLNRRWGESYFNQCIICRA